MKYIWLVWLPLLFLPNWGIEQQTAFGTLQLADYLIVPYIIFVLIAIWHNRISEKTQVDQLIPLIIVCLWWIVIITLLFPFRYNYHTNRVLIFSLLKVAKFSLYAVAGLLTIKALADKDLWSKFPWSILMIGLIVGINLLISRNSNNSNLLAIVTIEQAYQDNVVSTIVGILLIFILALRLTKFGSQRWQWAAIVTLIIMTLGSSLSDGRGGWVATIVSLFYLLYRLRLKRTLLAIVIGSLIIIVAYFQFSTFRKQVERTLNPDLAYLAQFEAGIGGIDDGMRLTLLRREGIKFIESPILGRGFFHRGELSGLSWWGSHNFFVQMFLEIGLVGGLLILGILWYMWRQAGSEIAVSSGMELPVKGALLAAFVAGLSGEYFYGGMALFTLFLVYGAVGRLSFVKKTVSNIRTVSAEPKRIA